MPSFFPPQGGGGLEPPIPLTDLDTQAAHTAVANLTGSTAVPTAVTMAALKTDLVSQNTVTATFSGPATSISVTGLDGDNDGDYEIDFDLTVALTNTRSFTLQPNGLATNQNAVEVAGGVSFLVTLTASTLELVSAVASTTRIWGLIRFTSHTGTIRKMIAWVHTDRVQSNFVMGEWTATTGNITGLSIVSAEANSITAASMKARKLRD